MGSVTVLIGAKVSQIGSAIGIPEQDPSDGGSSELIKVQTSCLSEDKMPGPVQGLCRIPELHQAQNLSFRSKQIRAKYILGIYYLISNSRQRRECIHSTATFGENAVVVFKYKFFDLSVLISLTILGPGSKVLIQNSR